MILMNVVITGIELGFQYDIGVFEIKSIIEDSSKTVILDPDGEGIIVHWYRII